MRWKWKVPVRHVPLCCLDLKLVSVVINDPRQCKVFLLTYLFEFLTLFCTGTVMWLDSCCEKDTLYPKRAIVCYTDVFFQIYTVLLLVTSCFHHCVITFYLLQSDGESRWSHDYQSQMPEWFVHLFLLTYDKKNWGSWEFNWFFKVRCNVSFTNQFLSFVLCFNNTVMCLTVNPWCMKLSCITLPNSV